MYKVLVVGDVSGQVKAAFDKIAELHKKQNFTLAIIAGNLFSNCAGNTAWISEEVQELLDGKFDIPLPVYFTLGRQNFPEDLVNRLEENKGELCPNVFALGRRGRVKTSEGITIVTISGERKPAGTIAPSSWYAGGYTDKEALGAISYHEADILITSDWPENIERGSNIRSPGPISQSSQTIATIVSSLKPAYHFSTCLAFYQREPFFHVAEKRPITRFLALAGFGNKLKEKAMYAFTIDPTAEPPTELPPGVHASPFDVTRKRKLATQQDEYKHQSTNGSGRHDNKRQKAKQRQKHIQPDSCYFCLSNSACNTHMIGVIGDESYVTIAKGPLTTKDFYKGLGMPGHMLIIPLVHAPTIPSIPGVGTAEATLKEMNRFQDALRKMVVESTKDDEKTTLGTVTFEISRAGQVHNHWQFVPVPQELIQNGAVEAAFKAEAEKLDYPAFLTDPDVVALTEEGNCVKVELWTETSVTRMAMPLDVSFRFDMQFMRVVLAKLLGLRDREHWKDCAQDQDVEEADTAKFKQLFEKYDFTQESTT